MKLPVVSTVATIVVSLGISGYALNRAQSDKEICEAVDFYERRFSDHDNLVSEVFPQSELNVGCEWQKRLHNLTDRYDTFDLEGFAASDLGPKCTEDQPFHIVWANNLHAKLWKKIVESLPAEIRFQNPDLVDMAMNPTSMNALFPSDKDLKLDVDGLIDKFHRYHEEEGTVFDHMDFSHPSVLSATLVAEVATSTGRRKIRALVRNLGLEASFRVVVMKVIAVGFLYLGALVPALMALVPVVLKMVASRFFIVYGPGLGLFIYLSAMALVALFCDGFNGNQVWFYGTSCVYFPVVVYQYCLWLESPYQEI